MLRNLIDEVRNRRVLAFAALGVLVALALPLLFLKGTAASAPETDTAAPAPVEQAKLPPRAARLLATSDAGTAGGRATGSAQDPFSPTASHRAAASAAQNGVENPTAANVTNPKTAPGGSPAKPVEVVVTNPGATGQSTSRQRSRSSDTPFDDSARSRRPTSSLTAGNASVDIRFGPRIDTRIRRAIPRRKAFYIHGKLVAVFVKYSPSRRAAVFAIAPGLHITGPVKCRVRDGSCRYLDIPAGTHAWITTITANRTIVRRRLDVIRIERRAANAVTRATSASARTQGSCLARKLMAMQRGDALLHRDACRS